MKKAVLVIAGLLLVASLGACNTWRGFGRDMEQAGEAIQRSGSK